MTMTDTPACRPILSRGRTVSDRDRMTVLCDAAEPLERRAHRDLERGMRLRADEAAEARIVEPDRLAPQITHLAHLPEQRHEGRECKERKPWEATHRQARLARRVPDRLDHSLTVGVKMPGEVEDLERTQRVLTLD